MKSDNRTPISELENWGRTTLIEAIKGVRFCGTPEMWTYANLLARFFNLSEFCKPEVSAH
jgi:hypothetical protein